MKHLLLTTIAAVVLAGCGESQQSAPAPEAKPVEPVAEAAQQEPANAKAPGISIHDAARRDDIVAVKQHLAAGTDVNAKASNGTPLHLAATFGHKEIAELLIDKGADVNAVGGLLGWTPLHWAAREGRKEVAELLIAKGADVNAKDEDGKKPLDWADGETADLLRKHGGKAAEELKSSK
ncbi:MAG: ankyrin repeat domain-containing protein [Pirellulales bacterium]|jgi:ankyrin repeat protein